ncbi:MAG: hypothetical protein DI551_06295 [Micavibrio aeruginosavorus]|uniref:Polysaccharide biosynthesis protein C-terminal domain-containing protein n=1 Tax=Micavibrio aeruginosavorus TaxID=349221 RepID=A0A2W5MX93_9BACT|nr:MAG: hypothetical protein DI551_06295 [Micavibrio aeruginosavorus]
MRAIESFVKSVSDLIINLREHRVILEGIVVTLLYKLFQLGLGLVTTHYIVHSFSKESFGQYNYILTILGVLSVFSLPNLNGAISQSVARGFYGTYNKAVPLAILSSLVATIILLTFAIYNYWENSLVLAYGFLLSALMFPLFYGIGLWKAFLVGLEQFKQIVKVASVNNVIKSVLLIATAIYFPDNVFILLLVYLAIPSLQNINQSLKLWKTSHKNNKTEEGSISYGVKASAYSIISLIATNIDNLLIFHFLSPVALANLAAAQRLPEVIKGGILDLGQILLPKFSRTEKLTKKIDQFFTYFGLAIGITLLIVTFTIFPYFFLLVFGDQYENALPYAQAMMLSLAIANTAPLKVWFMNSKLDSKTNRDMILIISVARITSSLLLIPFFGIWGAVASSFLHRIITSISIHMLMRKRYPVTS